MKPALKFPAKIKHGDSISSAVNPCRTKHHSVAEETRLNSVPRARRIRSISGPSTKPLQQMNQRYPARAMTSSPNSGDSLTACTPRNTTRDSLDFWKIHATRKQHREGHTGVRNQAVSLMQKKTTRSRPERIQGRQTRGQEPGSPSDANKTDKRQAEEESREKADRSRWRSGRKGIRR
ncbi:unnamed protein product [Pleuronectes platessa]|uniref:Uncharacterized protein n=1 Tax=Pleuronectes platessa TaxID=8262 RepID=A0A9N7UVR3_PLEPL|nr:unnamed protein product [Pleuronectes platessa]